jgi:signal transduction histidine kinase
MPGKAMIRLNQSGRHLPTWAAYTLALAASMALNALKLLPRAIFPEASFRVPDVLLVGLIAYLFGLGPALLAAAVSTSAIVWGYFHAPFQPTGPTHSDWASLTVFVIGTVIAAATMDRLRIANQRVAERTVSLEQEVAHRRQAEEALRESEAQLRTVLENTAEGVVVSDLEGHIIYWNRAALRMHGFAGMDECLRLLPDFADTFELSTPDGQVLPVDQWPLARVLRGEQLANLEVRVRRKDTNLRLVEVYGGSIIRGEDGRPLLALVTISDITERKQAEDEVRALNEELEKRVAARTAELEAANKELEAFSYSVSHDLRAPLRSVEGFSANLLKLYEDQLDERGKDYLRRVRSAAQRMGVLIDDILNLSRAGRVEMQLRNVDLSAMAREIADELRKSDPKRNVEFRIEDGLSARGDEHLLRIAMYNLLSNAWKFTGKQPQALIEFGGSEEQGHRVYYVKDNGVGFDPAYADRLFSPFQRLHTEDEFPGTGIGLALVQRVVRRHGGRVWAESAVGEGARFFFTLGEGK